MSDENESVREQVAWEIAGHVELYWDHGGICQSLGWTDAAAALLDPERGLYFDVHGAREYARGYAPHQPNLAQCILDAIEGQPSECPACDGEGWWVIGNLAGSAPERVGCSECRGTGHNTRGRL